jgi:hypothetical protein
MSLLIRRQEKEAWSPGGSFRTIMGRAVPNTIKIGTHKYVSTVCIWVHNSSPLHTVLLSQLKSIEIGAERILVTVFPWIGGQTTWKYMQGSPSGTVRSLVLTKCPSKALISFVRQKEPTIIPVDCLDVFKEQCKLAVNLREFHGAL